MKITDIHFEYQELFEEFFCSMLDIRNEARESLYKSPGDHDAFPDNEYEAFLRYGNFDLYGLTAASDDAEVYGWCLELWGLDCHCPIPIEATMANCPICRKPCAEEGKRNV